MSITENPSTKTVHHRVVDRFAAGWREPHPHAWDELLDEEVELRQPLMPDGVGRAHWQREFARLQALLPDLRGEVLRWAGQDDTVYVGIRCRATVGGQPLQFQAVDRLTITPDGTVTARVSYLDPYPLVRALLTRPRSWGPWWRSGVAPLAVRRALINPPSPAARKPQTCSPRGSRRRIRAARTLGTIRTAVGLTALASPRTAYRALNARTNTAPVGGFLARGFGIRELAIAALTLSPNPATSRLGLQLGVLVDATDTATILRGRTRITPLGHLLIGLPAAAFAITGIAALAGKEHENDNDEN